MKSVLVFFTLFLAACSSDDPDPLPVDAPAGTIDSPANVDAPMGNVCTGLLYDKCTTNAQCMSGTCRAFNNLGVSLCTQTCVPGGAACPTQGGVAVQCPTNAMICRPNAANTCTAP